jgi:nitrite reductase/ring-hydroxylating ferredoxin subunit
MIERAARPLAELWNWLAGAVDATFRLLGRPGKLLQDLLNGSWLGHTVHSLTTDVIGAATAALLLDLLARFFGVDGLELATTWVLGLAALGAIGSVLSGLTDFKDTHVGDERNVVGLHGAINIVGTLAMNVSLVMRLADQHAAAFWPLLAGFGLVAIGAYIGGDIVFRYGYMVNFNAFQKGKRASEFTAVLSAAELAEELPTRAVLGATALVLVRRGDVVHALKDTCPHAGGPLSGGLLDGDRIVCPWHGSTFRLRDGAVRHGPAATRAVRYQARLHEGNVEVRGPDA